jgi:putative FmdB family regulatory protein
MPRYDFNCPTCGGFEIDVPLAAYNEVKDGITCPLCEQEQATKTITSGAFKVIGGTPKHYDQTPRSRYMR